MGCFSWMKADSLGEVANVVIGERFKLLIPEKFGGGFIEDYYGGYGEVAIYDMYELLAIWNLSEEQIKHEANLLPLEPISEYTDFNRNLGITIGCYDEDMAKLKYPLKLVSPGYQGTYEDLDNFSRNDPTQGTEPILRSEQEGSL